MSSHPNPTLAAHLSGKFATSAAVASVTMVEFLARVEAKAKTAKDRGGAGPTPCLQGDGSWEVLNLVQEIADVGVSVKGTHIAPGKKPLEGDRKLFLALESTSEFTLNRAKAEIVRVLREELKRLASQGQQGPRGRYKVL